MTLEVIKSVYLICLVISVAYFIFLYVLNTKHNVYHLCMALLIVSQNVGSMSIVMADNIEMAALGHRIAYIPACLVPVALLFVWGQICGVRLKDYMRIILAVLGAFSLGVAWLQDYKGLYYKTMTFSVVNSIGRLEWEYGPYYFVFFVVLSVFVVCGGWLLVHALRSKSGFSYNTAAYLLAIWLCLVLGYFLNARLDGTSPYLDATSLGCTFSLLFYQPLFNKIGLYNMHISILNSDGRSYSNGYVVFDKKRRLTAYNDTAAIDFPELKDIRVDSQGFEYENTRFYELIYKPLFEMGKNTTDIFPVEDRMKYGEIRDLCDTFSGKIKGYMVEIVDDTYSFRTKEIMENSRDKLKRDVKNSTVHIEEIRQSITSGMASMIESRDKSTGGHIIRTSDVVRVFAERLSMTNYPVSTEFLNNVVIAAPMHDLGKIAVDDEVLKKQGKYTEEEFAKMKSHSSEGARIVRKVLGGHEDQRLIDVAVNVAHYHHEKWNGKGYPDGLKGVEIPLEARIMALADVFDALVSRRCYKEAYSYDEAFKIIEESSGSHFDPTLTEIFMQCRPELEALYNSNRL